VPNFVICLGDIEESCGTVMFIVKCFIYFVHNVMCLMDGRVLSTEAKLMVGYQVSVYNEGDETV
jgi:hypothetical protein